MQVMHAHTYTLRTHSTQMHIHARTRTCTYTSTRTQTHANTHASIGRAHIQTHTHTHAQAHVLSLCCLQHSHCDAPIKTQDEPFHVPQTQQYCRGDFHAWDPKITTLPGLYFLSAAVLLTLAWVTHFLPLPLSIEVSEVCMQQTALTDLWSSSQH